MRIDPKYFNLFLVIVGGIAAIIIALYTYWNLTGDERIFKERMLAQDSLRTVYWQQVASDDSLRIADYRGDFVILDFWIRRSGPSVASQEQLAELKREYGDRVTVIAASVGQQEEDVRAYMREYDYPFLFVSGSRHFASFDVPAIPAQLVYEPEGDLHSIFIGYRDSSRYDSLRAIIDSR